MPFCTPLHVDRTYSPTGESFFDAYWQTVCAGRAGFEGDELVRMVAAFRQWYDNRPNAFMWAAEYGWVWLAFAFAACYHLLSVFGFVRGRIPLPHYEQGRLMIETGGRRMIRSAKGYIGLAVPGTQVGDRIVLPQGGRMPFTIRSHNGQWRLVGDCYVHGVMKGALWDEEQCEILEICKVLVSQPTRQISWCCGVTMGICQKSNS